MCIRMVKILMPTYRSFTAIIVSFPIFVASIFLHALYSLAFCVTVQIFLFPWPILLLLITLLMTEITLTLTLTLIAIKMT